MSSSSSSVVQGVIAVKRAQNFPQWYQEVITEGQLATNSSVRGCMVIEPAGYALWESVQKILDLFFKKEGYENCYFPMFIPLSFFQREAEHVDGFAQECAVVTHYRLKRTEDGLGPDPAARLEEPLVVRPTSETIIGEYFSKKVRSYRDLPLIVNQWCNVVRWEHSTRLFLRTAEFLWQEGHTAHATEEEAIDQVLKIARIYRNLMENFLAIPVIVGDKSPGERFAGAVRSVTFEMMMQDGKALQGGTSHYLGQNFAKSFNIKYISSSNQEEYVHTTSWGVTTRLVGATVMVHGDDDGLRIPPKIAGKHVVIIPVLRYRQGVLKDGDLIWSYIDRVKTAIESVLYEGSPIIVHVDKKDDTPQAKSWTWIKKGVPIRLSIGQRDAAQNTIELARRDRDTKYKTTVNVDAIAFIVEEALREIQATYFTQALDYFNQNLRTDIITWEEFVEYFSSEEPKIKGFVKAKWCGDPETESQLKDLKVTIRCIPHEQSGTEGLCVITGKPATMDAIFAKSY